MRGALSGGFKRPLSPWHIGLGALAGGVLGYVGYVVSQWTYNINVMSMPRGFYKGGENICMDNQWGSIRHWTQYGFKTVPDADWCNNSKPGSYVETFPRLGTGWVHPNTQEIFLWKPNNLVAGYGRACEVWHRGVGTPVEVPGPGYALQLVEVPLYNPWDVDGLAVFAPAVTPAKGPPARSPGPGEEPPQESPETWPEVIPAPLVISPITVVPEIILPGVGNPFPVVPPPQTLPPTVVEPPVRNPEPTRDHPSPSPSPSPTTSPRGWTGGGPGGPLSPGVRTPPARGDKERKINIHSAVPRGAMVAINFVTEGLDFVGVLYKSIPQDCRRSAGVTSSRPSMTEKLEAIYHCFDAIPLADVIANWINNQFEDFVYGTLGRQVGRATGNFNVTTGLNRALREAQGAIADAGGGSIELPELSLDPSTGDWTLNWFGEELARSSGDVLNDVTVGDVHGQSPDWNPVGDPTDVYNRRGF